ncbi:MAG: hypothetical protein QXY39_03790 [Thermofilaceae archaeon]
MDKKLFERFCEKYPEYCDEVLFGKLFGNTVQIKELKDRKMNFVMSRGIVVNINKINTKKNIELYKGEICDKSDCINFVLFNNDINYIPKIGDDILFNGYFREWKGNYDLILKKIEYFGNIYESLSDGDKNDDNKNEMMNNNDNNIPIKKDDKGEDAIENFLKILREALNRGAKIRYDKMLKLLKQLNLNEKDVEKYIEIYEDVLPNSLEKDKFVKLKEGI